MGAPGRDWPGEVVKAILARFSPAILRRSSRFPPLLYPPQKGRRAALAPSRDGADRRAEAEGLVGLCTFGPARKFHVAGIVNTTKVSAPCELDSTDAYAEGCMEVKLAMVGRLWHPGQLTIGCKVVLVWRLPCVRVGDNAARPGASLAV